MQVSFILGFILGVFFFIAFVTYRALRSGHWDNSNIFNVLRLIGFVAVHPEDFPYMVDIRTGKKPFWYLPHDEFKEVVKTVNKDE